jgi:ubiquinone/menaquinone biosynthesis C-methylase UbiE
MTTQALAPPSAAAPPENYEHYFVPAIGLPIARSLIRAAMLRPGERVLDVGCGTGVVARLAARQVGSVGTVAGLDPNPGMLAVAAAVTPSSLEIGWHQAGAESMPLPDRAFDVVLCQMALQFVRDRGQGLREMRRVLADLGRIALNVPGPAAPPFEILADAMARHLGSEAAGFVRTVFALHETAELEALLADAGFRQPATSADTHDLRLPGPAEFLRQYVWSTPLAGIVNDASEESRAALETEVVMAWQRFGDGAGMRYRQRVVTATAVC